MKIALRHISGIAGLMLAMAVSAAPEAAGDKKNLFDNLTTRIQRVQPDVTDQDLRQMLALGQELGLPLQSAAAIKRYLLAAPPPLPASIQLMGASSAASASDFRTAVSRYKTVLATANSSPETSDAAAALYTILIDFLGAENDAYTFMKMHGARFRQSAYARQFDVWFLDTAQRAGEPIEVAKRLALIMAEAMPIEKERFFFREYLLWLVTYLKVPNNTSLAMMPHLKTLQQNRNMQDPELARFRFHVASLEYKSGLAGKSADESAKALAPALETAQVYLAAQPNAAVLRDIMESLLSNLQTQDWQNQIERKQAFFVDAIGKLPDAEKIKAMPWAMGWASYLATPDQWATLCGAYPAEFAKTEVMPVAALSQALLKKQAPALTDVTTPYAAGVKAAAAGADIESCARYLLDKESWHLNGGNVWPIIQTRIWPAVNNAPYAGQPPGADNFPRFLIKFGIESVARTPLPLLDPAGISNMLTLAWTAGDKSRLPELLHSFDWVPFSDAQRQQVFGGACQAFNVWAGQVNAAAEFAAVSKAKIKAYEDAKARKEAAAKRKQEAEARAAAAGATDADRAASQAAAAEFAGADAESARTAGPAADAREAASKMTNAPAADAAMLSALDKAFKEVMNPAVYSIDKAPNATCKNAALAIQALRAGKLDDYVRAARALCTEMKDFQARKAPLGAAVLTFALTNRTNVFDTFDMQLDVLTEQLAAPAAFGAQLALRVMSEGRTGWLTSATVADQPRILKINAVLEKALTDQLAKNQFSAPLFDAFLGTRSGSGWSADDTGIALMSQLVERKTLLTAGYRLPDCLSAGCSYMWLIRNRFGSLNEKYPPATYFDDMVVEEFSRTNQYDPAYFRIGEDRNGKIVNLVTRRLQTCTNLTVSATWFNANNNLWVWHAYCLRNLAAWRKEHGVDEAERSKLKVMLDSTFGKTRFDEFAAGDYYFTADAIVTTPEGRAAYFKQLADYIQRIQTLPIRSGPPGLEQLAPCTDLKPGELAALMAIFPQGTPLRWTPNRGFENLVTALPGGLLAQKRYGDLATVTPHLWKLARDLNNPALYRALVKLMNDLQKQDLTEPAGVISVAGLDILGAAIPDDVRVTLTAVRVKVLSGLGGTIAVDRTDPRYPIFMAQQYYNVGNIENAQEMYLKAPNKVREMFKELDPKFCLWLIDRNTEVREFTRAEELARAMMQWLDAMPEGLDPEIKARLMIAYADIALARQEFPRARALYERIVTAKEYANTAVGCEAELRIASVDHRTKNSDAAIERLNRLARRVDRTHQIQAYYQLARIKFDQEDYAETAKMLDQVFSRDPNHADAKILQGQLFLKERHYTQATDIKVGLPTSQRLIIPGKPLNIQMDDRNLAVVGKNKAVEVRVWTDSGDNEIISLFPAEGSFSTFEGQIKTQLGAPVKGDNVLQVLGQDLIHYDFSDAFKRNNNIRESTPSTLKTASDAGLFVSPGTILSEDEESQRYFDDLIDQARARSPQELQLLMASGAQRLNLKIRPGNPIHVRVIDPDRSVSATQNIVNIAVASYSGDTIAGFPLLETAPYSGVFEGTVPSTNAGILAYASDSSEGRYPYFAISADANPAWLGLNDNARPKIFTIDMNANIELGKLNLLANVPGRKLKQFFLQTSMDSKHFQTLCAWPTPCAVWNGQPSFEFVFSNLKTPPNTLEDIRSFIEADSMGYALARVEIPAAKTAIRAGAAMYELDAGRIPLAWSGTKDAYAGRFRAAFVLPSPQTRVFQLETRDTLPGPHVFFCIDDEPCASGDIRDGKMTIKRQFKKGLHLIDVFFYTQRDLKTAIALQSDTDKPPYLTICSTNLFNVTGTPEAAAVLGRTPATLSNALDLTSFDIQFAPETHARVLRLIMADFEGDAPAINKITLTRATGETLLPLKTDFAATGKNNILEIVAGDKISVIYRDPNIVTPGKEIHEKLLSASLHDGKISPCSISRTPGGQPTTNIVFRFVPGEKIDVMIEDQDLDTSDAQDVIAFNAKTESGKPLTIKALETIRHSGTFIGSVFTVKGEPSRPNDLRIAAGEDVILSYEDRENTDPGVPIMRQARLQQSTFELPQIRVFDVSSTLLDEPKTNQAAIPVKGDAKTVRLTREEYFPAVRDLIVTRPAMATTNTPASVLVGFPIVVEVTYPVLALSKDSIATLSVQMMPAGGVSNLADTSGFDPQKPGFLNIAGSPRNVPNLPPPPGYRAVLFRGEDTYSADPLTDGRFMFVVSNKLGKTEANQVTETGDPNTTLMVSGRNNVMIGFSYKDMTGGVQWVKCRAALNSDAFMDVLDRTYQNTVDQTYVGDTLYFRVNHASRDISDAKDTVTIKVAGSSGLSTNMALTETLDHSGIFKSPSRLVFANDKTALAEPGTLPVQYGDTLTITYLPAPGAAPVLCQVIVRKGSDGSVVPFTKRFKDPQMAVRTQFTIAEAYFELAKHHRKIGQKALARREIAAGRKLLEEALHDYPNAEGRAQADCLLADLTLEFADDAEDENIKKQKYQEAIAMFTAVILRYPDSVYAPKSQYKKALAFEKTGDMDQACEEYVKLSYMYPDNELVAETIARLGNYFVAKGKEFEAQAKTLDEEVAKAGEGTRAANEAKLKHDKIQQQSKDMFRTAAAVCGRLAIRFPNHELAGKTMVISGQCYMMAEDYIKATEALEKAIAAIGSDNDLTAEAMYWRGDAFMKAKRPELAYRQFKKLSWDYSQTKWAKFARGRLSEEALDRIATQDQAGGN